MSRLKKIISKFNVEEFIDNWITSSSGLSNMTNNQWEYIKKQYPDCLYNGDVFRFFEIDLTTIISQLNITEEDKANGYINKDEIIPLITSQIVNNKNFCSTSTSISGCNNYIHSSEKGDGVFVKFQARDGIDMQRLIHNFQDLLDNEATLDIINNEDEIITRMRGDYIPVGFRIKNKNLLDNEMNINFRTLNELNISPANMDKAAKSRNRLKRETK